MLRQVRAHDRSVIAELAGRISAFGVPSWRCERQMVARDVMLAVAAAEREDPGMIVAEESGTVVGFIWMGEEVDLYTGRPHGHISDLAVARSSEGKGIGKALLARAEEWARERRYEWLTLSTFPQNEGAVRLYRRSGFEPDIARLLKPLSGQFG